MTFYNAYLQYEKYIELKLKVQSVRSIKNRFKTHILPFFKDYDIYNLKTIDYLNWQLEIEKKEYSNKYNNALHTAITSFLNYCINYLNLNLNIASKVGKFKNKSIKRKTYKFYTIEDFNLFINYIDDEVYKQFFTFMFFVGTRPGETMALKFSDLKNSIISINKTIDERFYNNKRTINSPKTQSSNREIQIDSVLNKDLLNLKDLYIKTYNLVDYDYFIFGGLKPLAPTTINRKQKKACDMANLPKIRLHDFRHSHATLLLNNNLFINEISRRLGHSDVSITLNTYIHTDREQEKRVINTLNSLRLQ